MTILHLISSGGYYGAENCLITLAKSLKRLGCRSIVGVFGNFHAPHTEIFDEANRLGIEAELIPCAGRTDWQTVNSLRRLISRLGVDVLHTHGYKADFYGFVAARQLYTPIVATCHNWAPRVSNCMLTHD